MKVWTAAAAVAAMFSAVPAGAQELVINGGFEQTNMGGSSQFGQYLPSATVTGWNGYGLNAVYFPGTAEQGATTQYGFQDFKIYGPANGHNNGLTATSPAGGNFVMLDGDAGYQGIVTQTVTGLIAGKSYNLSFYMAAGQQLNYPGNTWDKYLTVSLGGQSQDTEKLAGPTGSFQDWRKIVMNFTAGSASEVLKFAAHGLPGGQPPVVFLDGVSMKAAVPEPASWAMLISGFGFVGAAVRRRRQVRAVA